MDYFSYARRRPIHLQYVKSGLIKPNNFTDENFPELAFQPSDRLELLKAMEAQDYGLALTTVLYRLNRKGVFANIESRDEALEVMARKAHMIHHGNPNLMRGCIRDAGLSSLGVLFDAVFEKLRLPYDPNHKVESRPPARVDRHFLLLRPYF